MGAGSGRGVDEVTVGPGGAVSAFVGYGIFFSVSCACLLQVKAAMKTE